MFEIRPVIVVKGVAQLVYDNVVDAREWCLHQLGVEDYRVSA